MSKQIAKIGDLTVTQFYGGERNGLSLQFSPDYKIKYSTLTIKQTRALVKVLQDWLAERELPFPSRPTIDAIPDKVLTQARQALYSTALGRQQRPTEHAALHALVQVIEQLKQ